MNKAYKYRLNLTDAEKQRLDSCFAVSRKMWNEALAAYLLHENSCRACGVEAKKISLSQRIKFCRKFTTRLKKAEGSEWMSVMPNFRFLDYMMQDLGAAWIKFGKACKDGSRAKAQAKYKARCEETGKKFKFSRYDGFYKPKFKSWRDAQSFRTDARACAKIDLSKGLFWLHEREEPMSFNIKPSDKILKYNIEKFTYFTISRTNTGKYFLSVGIKTDEHTPLPKEPSTFAGLDFGAKDMAAIAGKKVNLPDLSRIDYQIKKLQTEAANKYELNKDNKEWQRKNYDKLQLRIKKLQERKKNIRSYNTHKFTHAITECFDFVAIEDLNIKGMTAKAKPKLGDDGKTFVRNNKKQKAGLSKKLLNNNFGEIRRQLKYKQEWKGKVVHEIDRYYPSSKTCNVCGEKNNELTLSVRKWECTNCTTVHDRDTNAEINIIKRAITEAGIQPPDQNAFPYGKECGLNNHQSFETQSLGGGVKSSLPLEICTVEGRRSNSQQNAVWKFYNMLSDSGLHIE